MPAKKKTYHHGDLRRALLETARELTAEHGVDNWSMAAATKPLGVTHAAAYKHFANKGALVLALGDSVMGEFAESLRTAHRDATSVEERWYALSRAVVDFALRNPRLYAMAFGEYRSDDASTLQQAGPDSAFAVLRESVEDWKAAGWLKDGDTMDIALAMWSASHGLAMLVSTGRLRLTKARAHQLSDTTMRALHGGLGSRAAIQNESVD